MKKWYSLDIDETENELNSDLENGLSQAEAKKRLEKYGRNELVEKGAKTLVAILLDQLKDVMVIILIVAAVVSVVLGEENDAIVILAIVILNAIIGVSQEYRAEQAIAALKKLAVPTVRVRRGGETQEISSEELVPGDLLLLEAGNVVPADGRLTQAAQLRLEEAALTGESTSVDKNVRPIKDQDDVGIGDRMNMVHMGTQVSAGRGQVLITTTGMQTELGKIADLIQNVEREDTPLQKRLGKLGTTLAYVAVAIIAVVVILGIIRDGWTAENLRELFLTGISMAVAAVPEGLPAVVTITLALGSQRMLKRNSLIRKLPAVESLGSVTVICSDKTGTLTENRMTVTVLDVANEDPLRVETLRSDEYAILESSESNPDIDPPKRTLGLMVKAMALANDATLKKDEDSGEWRSVGDPTEGALVVAAAQVGLHKSDLESRFKRVAEVPFSSSRKRMTTIHQTAQTQSYTDPPWGDAPYVAFTKGAVDRMLDLSTHVWNGKEAVPIDERNMRQRIEEANARKAGEGQRVLGVAFRPVYELPSEEDMESVESGLIFIGVLGILDPPRAEVKDAVAKCRTAGIRPVMITGDHPLTARHIAKELDITRNDEFIIGKELNNMSHSELREKVKTVSVFARVSPEHKLNIVQAFQDNGEIPAMTGDGVNDAPALKKADIGVAMGITGTDVSKEAADMILLDDNFATIVDAIEEGRVIFDNIRKFINYTLSSNTGELLVMLIAPFFGMPLPLVPSQILWINLVTDGLPGLALAVEPGERGIMKRSPFHPQESIFSRGLGTRILWVGALMGLVSLAVGYFYWLRDPNGPWQTMVFTTLTLAQMGNALAIRSSKDSFFSIGIMSNPMAIGSVILTFLLQLMVIYVPFFQRFFNTQSLSFTDLMVALVCSTVVFWAVEAAKWWNRRSG